MTISDDPAASHAVVRTELNSVTCKEELAKLLSRQYVRADMSLRELELRSSRTGGVRLARATCADMLAGRRFPKKAMMVTFLRLCQVPEEQLPDWERAWERVKLAQSSAPQASEAVQPLPEPLLTGPEDDGALQNDRPTTDDEPAPVRKPVRRRMRVAAGLSTAAGLITAAGVYVFAESSAPPPRVLTDDGRAFGKGGSSRFVVNIDPDHTRIRLTRRLDAGIAMQTATVTVDATIAALWQPLTGGPHGWREQSVLLPTALTLGRHRLTIANTFVNSALDFNEFAYFVHQEVDGAWSLADSIDVGPNHPESEEEHQYRITHETWSGTNPVFAYLE
ncbi:hypothetical protein [Actinocorallia libanotica]|uniref:Helix-turn-helix protein n=1 Tax=Actinocorallia libanotica TaxID=46162 RepID=A0ABP4BQM7_9ACTN